MAPALGPESADRRFPSIVSFLAAKVVEYVAGVVGLAILFGLCGSEYTLPTTPDTPVSLVVGAAFVAALYFVAFGYILISALTYFVVRLFLRGRVKPVAFALVLSMTFGMHAFAVAIWARFGIPSFYLFIAGMAVLSFAIHYLLGKRSLGRA